MRQSFETSLRQRATDLADELARECAPNTTSAQAAAVDPSAAVVRKVGGSLLLGVLPPDAEKADVVARERLLECLHERSTRVPREKRVLATIREIPITVYCSVCTVRVRVSATLLFTVL